MSFESLGLNPALLSALDRAGFTQPTPVQEAAIPRALTGEDLMVSSQTGSGKTAAFMLPVLHRIAQLSANKGSGVQVLVLTPTRELALQVADATRVYGAGIAGLRIATVVGGMPYGAQIKALSRRVDVLVATPGRLIDHLQAKRVNLSTVRTLVLDEADRMLDMGFIEEIESIIERLPAERQTLLFSATLDGTVAQLAKRMMRDPARLELAGQKQRHENIEQTLLYADDGSHKLRLLDHLLRDSELDQAIVFTSTKRGADDLADYLAENGYAAAALHGDMNQRQRTRTLGLLQRGTLRILVATDVAARGIDVQGISHAFNYDLPMQAEDYVHRIGRTGRAGRNGQAYTLATHTERHKIRRIEHFIGRSIPMGEIAGLEPQRRPQQRSFGKRPGGGGGGYRGAPNGARREGYGQGRPQGERESSWKGGERKHDGKPEWKAGPKTEWKPGQKPEWKSDRRPEGRAEWQPGRKWEGKPEWKPGRKADWAGDRQPQADDTRRPGRPAPRGADRGAAPRRTERPQRATARF
ncbi:DEAD/DEAH box helicase [Alcaligenaceae bacterium]|nr:DEAD/DEAH box helicase [Alcaligenaceae bacterium]